MVNPSNFFRITIFGKSGWLLGTGYSGSYKPDVERALCMYYRHIVIVCEKTEM